ncbi:MAG: SRPBCC family protein [Chloroflexi bacterium]|nr:SRPBCC family protein [Chloroflexota bacterium]
MAETKLELTIFIQRPISDVFEFVSKAENMPKWAGKIVDAAQTSEGPVDVGTTCYVVAKAMGREAKQDFVVTECIENKTYVAKSTSGPIEMETGYELESIDGGTKLHATVTANMGGLMAMAGPLIARKMKAQFDKDHANLKRLLES